MRQEAGGEIVYKRRVVLQRKREICNPSWHMLWNANEMTAEMERINAKQLVNI